MKAIWNFLKSMKFGIILLTCILLLCLPGTVIEQGKTAEAYIAEYGDFFGNLIVKTGFDHLFSTWYFAGLFLLLCLNLLLCSILRLPQTLKRRDALLKMAEKKSEDISCDVGKAIRGARQAGKNLYLKNAEGLFGSFITHLGLLLLLLTAALVLKTQVKYEVSVHVGERVSLSDNQTSVTVQNFSMENVLGETDYVSELLVELPDGAKEEKTVSVNHPYRTGKYTVYQQAYNIDVTGVYVYTDDDPEPAYLALEGSAFLTLDGKNGISIQAIYGDYNIAEDGQMEAFNYMDGSIKRPCYLVETIDNGTSSTGLVLPGTTLCAGGVYCQFPQYFPIFEVKELSPAIMPTMYLSFALLLIGLYLCFFRITSAYHVRGNRVAVAAYKDEKVIIKQLEKENKAC